MQKIKKIKVRNHVAVSAHFRKSWVEINSRKVIPRKLKYRGRVGWVA